MRRLFFAWRYLVGRTSWDTEITPPELIELIETEGLTAGRALELGCGTGTNAVYLAQHGWQVTAIDFVGSAIRRAVGRARRAGVSGHTEFMLRDVTRLGKLGLPKVDFVLDIGCLHSLPQEGQRGYAEGLTAVSRPGATYLLYAFKPRIGSVGPMGMSPDRVESLFAPYFRVVDVQHCINEGNDMASAWYRLERVA